MDLSTLTSEQYRKLETAELMHVLGAQAVRAAARRLAGRVLPGSAGARIRRRRSSPRRSSGRRRPAVTRPGTTTDTRVGQAARDDEAVGRLPGPRAPGVACWRSCRSRRCRFKRRCRTRCRGASHEVGRREQPEAGDESWASAALNLTRTKAGGIVVVTRRADEVLRAGLRAGAAADPLERADRASSMARCCRRRRPPPAQSRRHPRTASRSPRASPRRSRRSSPRGRTRSRPRGSRRRRTWARSVRSIRRTCRRGSRAIRWCSRRAPART